MSSFINILNNFKKLIADNKDPTEFFNKNIILINKENFKILSENDYNNLDIIEELDDLLMKYFNNRDEDNYMTVKINNYLTKLNRFEKNNPNTGLFDNYIIKIPDKLNNNNINSLSLFIKNLPLYLHNKMLKIVKPNDLKNFNGQIFCIENDYDPKYKNICFDYKLQIKNAHSLEYEMNDKFIFNFTNDMLSLQATVFLYTSYKDILCKQILNLVKNENNILPPDFIVDNITIKYFPYTREFIITTPTIIAIDECSKEFIVLNLDILDLDMGHANILIYNPNIKEVEIFDPTYTTQIFNEDEIKIIVEKLFPIGTTYVPQKEYITRAFQDEQEKEKECEAKDKFKCSVWVIWYAYERLKYPKLSAKEAFKQIEKSITDKCKTKIINDFAKMVLKK